MNSEEISEYIVVLGVKSKRGRELSVIGVWGDLSLINVIDRRVRLPLSKWRGYGLNFFSARWRVGFPEQGVVLGWF